MELFAQIVFYVVLIDSLVASVLAWGNSEWYVKHFRTFSRYFPLTKGWATWYVILALWIGFLTLYR